jgi:hypothetical protein
MHCGRSHLQISSSYRLLFSLHGTTTTLRQVPLDATAEHAQPFPKNFDLVAYPLKRVQSAPKAHKLSSPMLVLLAQRRDQGEVAIAPEFTEDLRMVSGHCLNLPIRAAGQADAREIGKCCFNPVV